MTFDSGPNRKLVTGCGVGCAVALAFALTVLLGTVKNTRAVYELAGRYLDTAVRGDLGQAYAMVHPSRRAALPQPEFEALWHGVRAAIGKPQKVDFTGQQPDLKRSVLTLKFRVTGDRATVPVEVDINPKDRPLAIVDTRADVKPAAAPAAPKPAEKTPAPATAK